MKTFLKTLYLALFAGFFFQTASGQKLINVNLYGNNDPYASTQWNNWNIGSTLSFSNFKYSDGTASTIDAAFSSHEGLSTMVPAGH